jgi:predicted metal-binding membrane protein
MGIAHGRDCAGCCWALMALMFVAGSLHLLWTAALAMLMLAEKALRSGRLLGRIAGAVLMLWGAYRIGAQLVGPA